MEDERVNGIAALLEQGRYLAAQTDAFPSTTETVEALNHAQEGIEEVAKNPGIILHGWKGWCQIC